MTTNAPDPAGWQPSLPGLTLDSRGTNALATAARATLAALDAQGLLQARHTVTAQLVLELADVVGRAVSSGKAAAAGMAAKQLIEAIGALPEPREEDGDAFSKMLAEMAEAERRQEADRRASGGAA